MGSPRPVNSTETVNDQRHVTPVPSSDLFWRQFRRGKEPHKDILARSSFLDQNFVDDFGVLLRQVDLRQFQTYDQILMNFSENGKYELQVFCVADGFDIDYDSANAGWFNPHIRFLSIVTYKDAKPFDGWTLLIIGSDEFDSGERVLQAASWDVNGQTLRFYGRETLQNTPVDSPESAWIYQGTSFDAFRSETSYLGPFSGHVNGVPIMKELKNPWLHWINNNSNLRCASPGQRKDFANRKYLSNREDDPLSRLKSPRDLEPIIRNGIKSFFAKRRDADFKIASGLNPSPPNIQRWMAHLLLTTTVNIHCGFKQGQRISIPAEHFLNLDLLAISQSDLFSNGTDYWVDESLYNNARGKLGLCLLQELDEISSKTVPETLRMTLYPGVLGAGKDMGDHAQVQFAKALEGEGNNGLFTVLTPSYEDIWGVDMFQNIERLKSLLSPKVFDSLLMVDFCNPVYSWRRGVLMQYVPTSTALSDQDKYDLESNFITALENSPYATCDGQPECEFLSLYRKHDPDSWADRTAAYSKKIKKNLEEEDYVLAYMELAESRRRIYRPLPLDEFGFTLPFATKYDTIDKLPLKEMTDKAEVVDMPTRGVDFITAWTGTLWTNNPVIVAQESNPPLAPGDLPKPERTPVDLGSFSARKNIRGCPVMRKRRLSQVI